jgi:hypothetical protein
MDAKQCPHCKRWALKDNACNYIFACGLTTEGIFIVGGGCGKTWCWECGKKYCGQYYTLQGEKCKDAKDIHTDCCIKDEGFTKNEYCEGGHSAHCLKRW